MIAVLDANVLFPQYVCDLFLSLADAGLFRPVWSDRIHDEWTRNVLLAMPSLDVSRIERRRQMMDDAFRFANVPVADADIESVDKVHPKDRHVMAAAVVAGADVVVTFNVRDFGRVASNGIPAVHPDDFLCQLFEQSSITVRNAIHLLRGKLTRPAISIDQLLIFYARSGLPRFAAALAPFADQL